MDGRYFYRMSYNLSLECGCEVYVSRHPETGVAHTRIIEKRGARCGMRKHSVGVRLFLWELLPEPRYQATPRWADPADEIHWCS